MRGEQRDSQFIVVSINVVALIPVHVGIGENGVILSHEQSPGKGRLERFRRELFSVHV